MIKKHRILMKTRRGLLLAGAILFAVSNLSVSVYASEVTLQDENEIQESAAEDAGEGNDDTQQKPEEIGESDDGQEQEPPEEVENDEELLASYNELSEDFRRIAEEKDILALVYLTDNYDVRKEASLSSDVIASVMSGQSVQILGVAFTADGVFSQVGFYQGDVYYEGYIERVYLASSDEDLLNWEEENFPESTDEILRAANNADISAFPDSYKAGLTALKSRHPNWTFVRMNTGLDFNTVIKNEIGERSLVEYTSPESWKNGKYSSAWYYASEGILKYYIDPRNFLNEQDIFQFELLTYNATYHTKDAVQHILDSTFMSGQIPGSDKSYSQAFYEIGSSLKVSPFHLACRVYQEQGKGTSALISGTFAGYENLYNYFNIGASGNTDYKVITSGLERARKEGWDTRYKSLSGGARLISEGYILRGQDTLYLQKYDVDAGANGLYWHQYMQNIEAACSEGRNIRRAYTQAGSLDNTFVFKIPVYNNMPASACPQPSDTVQAWPFKDVAENPGNWKYENIKFVYENGIMTGTEADIFEPDSALTRAMFASVLYRMSGSPQVTYKNIFSDVPAGKWHSNAIIWAYEKGIVAGLGSGRYGIDDNITREQMARMLHIYAQVNGYDISQSAELGNFADASLVSGWALNDVKWAVGAGIISGSTKNGQAYLNPKGAATRAECAVMLKQFMSKY